MHIETIVVLLTNSAFGAAVKSVETVSISKDHLKPFKQIIYSTTTNLLVFNIHHSMNRASCKELVTPHFKMVGCGKNIRRIR